MRVFVGHVCEFVEKNSVPWVDVNEESSSVVKKTLYRLLQYLKPSCMCL